MKKIALILMALLLGLTVSANATMIQFDPTGTGNFANSSAVRGVFEFDWQSSGNLVIEQFLAGSASNGASTLAEFFAIANDGDTLQMNIHAHARLNDFLDDNGASINAPGFSSDGGATGTYEVTMTLDALETAEYREISGEDWLFFTGIDGTFNYYLDTDPDSVVATGLGFNNGDTPGTSTLNPFLTGTLGHNSGSFNGATGTGSSFLNNTITAYDKNIIDVDPNTNPLEVLIGTSFDSTIKFLGNQTGVGVGGSIGDTPYIVQQYQTDVDGDDNPVYGLQDLVLNADANSEWDSVVIPEPATLALFGIGLLGLAGISRRRIS